jgi:hypothetical protein
LIEARSLLAGPVPGLKTLCFVRQSCAAEKASFDSANGTGWKPMVHLIKPWLTVMLEKSLPLSRRS